VEDVMKVVVVIYSFVTVIVALYTSYQSSKVESAANACHSFQGDHQAYRLSEGGALIEPPDDNSSASLPYGAATISDYITDPAYSHMSESIYHSNNDMFSSDASDVFSTDSWIETPGCGGVFDD